MKRDVISERSETDYNRCPLYFPLFVEGQKPYLERYGFLGTLRDGEGNR